MTTNATTIRFNDDYTRNLAKVAAQMQGQSISSFIMSAIREHAENVIRTRTQAMREFGQIVLDAKDYEALLASLANPPKPADTLKKAAAEYKQSNIKRKGY
ncbi:hypothetical protein AGMMS50229_17400 [Campylobacterota bacterium]|nr:hypothetical protein AGMMS50229_17400 [Campylobacterota bacterium]